MLLLETQLKSAAQEGPSRPSVQRNQVIPTSSFILSQQPEEQNLTSVQATPPAAPPATEVYAAPAVPAAAQPPLPRRLLRRLFARLEALEGSSAASWIASDALNAQVCKLAEGAQTQEQQLQALQQQVVEQQKTTEQVQEQQHAQHSRVEEVESAVGSTQVNQLQERQLEQQEAEGDRGSSSSFSPTRPMGLGDDLSQGSRRALSRRMSNMSHAESIGKGSSRWGGSFGLRSSMERDSCAQINQTQVDALEARLLVSGCALLLCCLCCACKSVCIVVSVCHADQRVTAILLHKQIEAAVSCAECCHLL